MLLDRYLDRHAAFKHHFDRRARHIDRHNLPGPVRGIQKSANLGHILLGLHIVLVLIREAAKQTPADARDFRGIER